MKNSVTVTLSAKTAAFCKGMESATRKVREFTAAWEKLPKEVRAKVLAEFVETTK